MQNETIIEKGIVISSGNGHAEIALIQTGACEECSAKIFCKPSENKDSKILEVEDSFGVQAGDEVDIEIKGSDVLKASFMLYGIPLILIIIGIMTGMEVFQNLKLPELLSFIFGIALNVIYFSGFFFFNKINITKAKLPQITFVKRL